MPALSRWRRWRLEPARWVKRPLGRVPNGRRRSVAATDVNGLIGKVVFLAEQDYRYGTGSLRLRVEDVDVTEPFIECGECWYWVEGTQVSVSGEDLRPRAILVRARHLRG
jgi:hypothetical protein